MFRLGVADRGQTAVEYLGLVLVVVALVGGLVATGIGAELTAKIGAQVCRLGGGADCGGGDPQARNGGEDGGENGTGETDDGKGDATDADAGADGTETGDSGTGDTHPVVTDPLEKTQAEKDYDAALKELQDAEGEYEKEKQKAVEAAKKLAAILAEELGITDAVKCFTEGNAASCGETAINIVTSLIGGLPAKVLKKYGWPTQWKKGKEVVENLIKHGGDTISGAKGMWDAKKKIDRLKGKVEDLKKKLPKREKKPDDPNAPDKAACRTGRHSFLPGTQVLLADGTRTAIEDVRLGDLVTVTDPDRGLTTARPVVALITTEDDKDFTVLTVLDDGDGDGHARDGGRAGGRRAGDSGAVTLTATDTHPFWLADERRWTDAGDIRPGDRLRTSSGADLPVTAVGHFTERLRTHDLTIGGIHTYYVGVGSASALVHNNNPCKKRTEQELRDLADDLQGSSSEYQKKAGNDWDVKNKTTAVIRARFPDGKGGWVEKNVVAASGEGLSLEQISMARQLGDVPVEMNKKGYTHAEHNALLAIDKAGGVPIAGGASRSVCSEVCGPFIRGTGGRISGKVYSKERGTKIRTFYWLE